MTSVPGLAGGILLAVGKEAEALSDSAPSTRFGVLGAGISASWRTGSA